MHERTNDWYEIDQVRVCVCVSCPVCVCVQCACACARDVQHDMLGPVMVQQACDLDLRYVHGDDEESRPHILAAMCLSKNISRPQRSTHSTFAGCNATRLRSTSRHMQICVVSSCRVGSCEILYSYTTMGAVAYVHAHSY